MVTIKTPTRTVEITMTTTNSDGTVGLDYASDYIGNLSDANLKPCDCSDAEHTYHADDDAAQWWIDHCAAHEDMNNRVAGLTGGQQERFRAEAEAQHTFDVDAEQQPGAGMALMDELFGNDEPTTIVEIGPSLGDCSDAEYAAECSRLDACYTEVEGDKYSVTVRPTRAGEASGTYLVRDNGNLQILGYSLSIEDTCPGLHEIQEAAFAKFCK